MGSISILPTPPPQSLWGASPFYQLLLLNRYGEHLHCLHASTFRSLRPRLSQAKLDSNKAKIAAIKSKKSFFLLALLALAWATTLVRLYFTTSLPFSVVIRRFLVQLRMCDFTSPLPCHSALSFGCSLYSYECATSLHHFLATQHCRSEVPCTATNVRLHFTTSLPFSTVVRRFLVQLRMCDFTSHFLATQHCHSAALVSVLYPNPGTPEMCVCVRMCVYVCVCVRVRM